jgi:malate dehydrogenase
MAHSIDKKSFKVCLVGASGGIGQVLALLLKMNHRISELSLYDVMNTIGVAADLSHVSTTTKVTGYVGPEQLPVALNGSDVVVVVAGVPRKPGMSRDDLFSINAKIVYGIAESCAIVCPSAMFLVISNPVNSNVPIFAEVLRSHGKLSMALYVHVQ